MDKFKYNKNRKECINNEYRSVEIKRIISQLKKYTNIRCDQEWYGLRRESENTMIFDKMVQTTNVDMLREKCTMAKEENNKIRCERKIRIQAWKSKMTNLNKNIKQNECSSDEGL